jgi:hypothetical protein
MIASERPPRPYADALSVLANMAMEEYKKDVIDLRDPCHR